MEFHGLQSTLPFDEQLLGSPAGLPPAGSITGSGILSLESPLGVEQASASAGATTVTAFAPVVAQRTPEKAVRVASPKPWLNAPPPVSSETKVKLEHQKHDAGTLLRPCYATTPPAVSSSINAPSVSPSAETVASRPVNQSKVSRKGAKKVGKSNKPRRPQNAFMMWSSQGARLRVSQNNPGMQNAHVSKLLGQIWRSMNPDEKQAWKVKAKAAAEQHKKEHPNYRYGPGEEHYKKKRWDAAAKMLGVDLEKDDFYTIDYRAIVEMAEHMRQEELQSKL
jgi:hypothetical protein